MPNPSQKQQKLLSLLRELFQLNQPDLDFGLYRIMHAKAREIEHFLEHDLLQVIQQRLGGSKAEKVAQAKANYERERQNAVDYGGNPDTAPKAMQALAEYQAVQQQSDDDEDLYDQLYRFFERYYDEGDFLSRRYYGRETGDKAAPYAVPYDGSEVYLHWANKDQYYIKSSETFRQFSVDISQTSTATDAFTRNDAPARVHFILVDAQEGEHNNTKAANDKERYFIIDADNPLEWRDGELVLRFHYRADPEKPARASKWRDERNARNEAAILQALASVAGRAGEYSEQAQRFHQALTAEIPKGRDGTQTLLAKYLNQYTARNTMDYFIHKDLGGFLKRELDYYIKNELFRLDELGNGAPPDVQNYQRQLQKALTLREVAMQLIAFLAQTENFQKKLWLKKKFVVETQWLVTLDKVPVELYPQIAANDAQWAEWEKLGFVGAGADRTALVNQESKLVLDTRFFDAGFTACLIASIPDLDAATDGVLVHSENFQALNLMQARYRDQVKCIYIDPPYNTGDDGFSYKDSYIHSSWLSMVIHRIQSSVILLSKTGAAFTSIGNDEAGNLRVLLDGVFPEKTISFLWKSRAKPTNAGESKYRPQLVGEFVFQNSVNKVEQYFPLISGEIRRYPNSDEHGRYRTSTILTSNLGRYRRETMRFEVAGYRPSSDKRWKAGESEIHALYRNHRIGFNEDGEPYLKIYEGDDEEQHIPLWTFLPEDLTGTAESGKSDLSAIVGNTHGFDSVKPKELITVFLNALTEGRDLILDYFAGSGTTGHAVIELNREDDGNRKYLLVEMGDYFDTVLKPRITKVIYSSDWKDGKPTSPETGISQLVKVIRLESYEDTLNNLRIAESSAMSEAVADHPELKQDYFLHYMLDLETSGSQSLLNVAGFADPTAYLLQVKKPGADGQETRAVDLVETFNWLLGLRVTRLLAPQTFRAEFSEVRDAELGEGAEPRLVLDGALVPQEIAGQPHWWLRAVQGTQPDGKVAWVIWRKLTGDAVRDNLVLEAYLREVLGFDVREEGQPPCAVLYVNGSHALPLMPRCDVRQLEEAFHRLMWDVQDV